MTPLTLFSVGHSNHSFDRFLELLESHQVGALVDIRRFPGSRKHPHFNTDQLEAALKQAGIEYHWLEELGGRRGKPSTAVPSVNQGLRNDSFRNFADYMSTAEFRQGIEKLIEIAGQRATAVMCAEGLWWQCHRRLVSDHLQANGTTVEHIMPNGQLKPHAMTPGAHAADARVTYPAAKSLFDDAE